MKKEYLTILQMFDVIASEYGVDKRKARRMINLLFNRIKIEVYNGNVVTHSGFGRFSRSKVNLNLNRGIKSKKKGIRYTIKFKPSYYNRSDNVKMLRRNA